MFSITVSIFFYYLFVLPINVYKEMYRTSDVTIKNIQSSSIRLKKKKTKQKTRADRIFGYLPATVCKLVAFNIKRR